MKLRYTILPLFIFCCTCIQAKENKDLMKANYYYTHCVYYKAIPYFEKIAAGLNDPVVWSELGDCYNVTNDLQKAADAYGKAVNMQSCSKAVVLRYAQILMQLMQYDDAKKWLKIYQASYPDDKRIANLIAGCGNAKSRWDAIPEGTSTLLPFNTDGSDFAPTMWKGKLVFTSDTDMDVKKKTDNWTGRSYYNIFSIKCDNKGQCDSGLDKISGTKGVNIKYHDGPCTFSADGRQMYFTRSRSVDRLFGNKSVSNKDSLVVLEIMIASDYDTSDKKFKTIEPFPYNNEAYAVQHPAINPNGKILVFSSNMPKGYGGSDLYMCKKTRDSWSKPQNLGNVINTEGEEVFPYWADNNTLFFSSDGHEGLGGLDIYKTTWDANTNAFTTPENIGTPVNSSYDDISLAMYADGRSTYFSSNRPAAKGGDNIYFFKKEKIFLQITVVDSLTQQPVADAKISVEGKGNKDEKGDNNGHLFMQLYPETSYKLAISKEDYQPARLDLFASTNKETDTIFKTVRLWKPAPAPLPKDTIPPVIVRNPNIMDTPGIRQFELGRMYEVGHFYYEKDKYDLTEKHKIILDTLLTQMNRHPTMRIQIRAHTDCRGTAEHNQLLSNNRALSVVNYLVKHGIKQDRLEYIGLGNTMPTVPCPDCNSCTEEQHSLNRLLEFKVLQL